MTWVEAAETVLTQLGVPYDYRTFECNGDLTQLPDNYIVYFLVDDVAGEHFDNKETDHQPRMQVSFYFRDKSQYLAVPAQIEAAFMAADFMRVGASDLPYDTTTFHNGWRCDFRFYEKR